MDNQEPIINQEQPELVHVNIDQLNSLPGIPDLFNHFCDIINGFRLEINSLNNKINLINEGNQYCIQELNYNNNRLNECKNELNYFNERLINLSNDDLENYRRRPN